MRHDKLLRAAFYGALAAFAAYALWHYVYWTLCPYPNEFREAALLQIGDLFMRGVNPYSESGPDNFCFIYGFMEPLVAAGLSNLIGAGMRLLEPRLVTLGFVFATALLVELFFPAAERALSHYDSYVRRTLSRLDAGDYDLVVIAKEDSQLGCERIPKALYEERENYSIRSGEQVRTVALYRRRIAAWR